MRTARTHNAAAGATVGDYRFDASVGPRRETMTNNGTQAFQGINSAPPEAPRPITEFDMPPEYAGPASSAFPGALPIRTVGLVELTPEEELSAARRAGDGTALAFELWKYSLREVNGKPVSLADGTTDTAVKSFTPQARAFVMSAYAEVNSPDAKVVADFLKRRRIKAG